MSKKSKIKTQKRFADRLLALQIKIESLFYKSPGNALDLGGIPGLYEIINNEPYCCLTLRQLKPGNSTETDEGMILEQAWLERHWSYVKNSQGLSETAELLRNKAKNNLNRQGKPESEVRLICSSQYNGTPGLRQVLGYVGRFYIRLLKQILNEKILPGRYKCWTLYIGKGNFTQASLADIKPIRMPKGVFWADPFLYDRNGQLYAFFENYSYKTKKGVISAGKVTENKGVFEIIAVQDVLVRDYHLSYPYIFEEGGEIFIIPETKNAKRVEIYRCASFPDRWELYAQAFEGEEIVDTTYFRGDDGKRWLFLSRGRMCKPELYIYQIDSLKLTEITPHEQNPVMIDCRKARSGGAIYQNGTDYYRPSQINTHGVYGKGLQISKIKKLTLEKFETEPVISVYPDFDKKLIGMHHMHQYNGYFIFDGCYKRM